MKSLTILILLFITQTSFSQTFLKAYNEFSIARIKSQKNDKKTNKRIFTFFASQIEQLDTIFNSYLKRKKFDFNTADSLKIIQQSSIESGLSDYIIWSNKDTISFEEYWIDGYPKKGKGIEYKPFLDTTWNSIGYQNVNSRDSLMTLMNKHDFSTAQKLSQENPVYDGASSTIMIAVKTDGKYIIEEYYLKPFGISGRIRRK